MGENMSDLKEQAEGLGIKVDGRWSDERIQQEIDKALAAPPAPPERLIPVRVNRDFWDDKGERFRKGSVVEVSVDAALNGVESGAFSRVKE
jgi:hypothetical protein